MIYEILDTDAFMLIDTPACNTLEEAKNRCDELEVQFRLKEGRLVPVGRGE